ncbi:MULTISPECIES: diaminopimelate decarboxylase [Micromonospora]|uniref:Diaminopimelate decarboxylase n=1 Tax=Micromonospora aurantiaca (nom. illeg.) TaxID=47850 RepID=A0A6N3JSX7_9ACTN|nr:MULTISPECIES: diaminopimelate decarboxylase [Micromonospora]AXH88878.1 diaminopimelate decarboxylase [Micromonospora aurantiaca]KAB1103094.1 diaminopimelate decarboxylase [Micromonospora aurantiaca]MDG4753968.1 diaminopimelate decarboxylase [Micromonospora sp. WMMD718]UFN93655.1 diaminopimelate decarboxylase [Micromonospora aurantiaca]
MRAHEAGALHGEIGTRGPAWLRTPVDVNALVPQLWPRNVARGPGGALTVAGLDVRDLAAEYGTPAYVLDEDDLRERCREFRAAFPDADVYYAGKAFLCRAVVRMIAEEGMFLDVCTGGELATALSAGMPPERIGFHGNNKSVAELTRAVDAGVGRIIVDSFTEIDRLSELARERGVRPKVLVRVTVGVEAHTHEFIATAHEDQKFGFSLAGGAAAAAAFKILDEDVLELRGLHSHIGSQIFDASGFEVSARRVLALQSQIRDARGVELPELDLGGGFGIAYTTQDDPASPHDLAKRLRKIVDGECAAENLAVPHLSVEPGRAIVGPAVFTLYQAGTVKDVDGLRTYVSVDGGMSDNIRTALYDASYSATLANRTSTAQPMLARVVGKHCESGDIVVKDEFLPADVQPGDLVAVPGTGAYCRSMASNYNHVPRPPVVAVREGRARLIVRRETEDDLLALDVG